MKRIFLIWLGMAGLLVLLVGGVINPLISRGVVPQGLTGVIGLVLLALVAWLGTYLTRRGTARRPD